MDGCIYRTKDGECDLYADGGKYKAFCDMENCKDRKMSNADRIRTMTDEELALIFAVVGVSLTNGEFELRELKEEYLKWLKQENE